MIPNPVFAVPKPGVLVRHPDGRPLDAAGEVVERSAYWLRRERDEDVTLEPAGAVAPTKTTKT